MGDNVALGAEGERIAAESLTAQGLSILERNWRSRHGEIDLIATDRGALVFVEVKTRTGVGFGLPAEAVTAVKQRRIRLLAVEWMRASGRGWPRLRFDVVSVLLERGRDPRVDHLEDAF